MPSTESKVADDQRVGVDQIRRLPDDTCQLKAYATPTAMRDADLLVGTHADNPRMQIAGGDLLLRPAVREHVHILLIDLDAERSLDYRDPDARPVRCNVLLGGDSLGREARCR